MVEKFAVRVKNGKLLNVAFDATTVFFTLDHSSASDFLFEVPVIGGSHAFRYKRVKAHVDKGEYIIQSDGFKVVLYNQDPIYDVLNEKSAEKSKSKVLVKPSPSIKSNPPSTSTTGRFSIDPKVTATAAARPVIKASETVKAKTTAGSVVKDSKGLTPEKSRPASASSKANSSPVVSSSAPASRQIGYESPFKLRSPELSAKLTPNSAEIKKRPLPQPLFPSHIIGQAGTTPLRDTSLYDTTATSDVDVDISDDMETDHAYLTAATLAAAAGSGTSSSRDQTPVKLRDQRALSSLPGVYSRNPTVGAFTDVDIFSPKPGVMKQYGNKRKAPLYPSAASAAAATPMRYLSPTRSTTAATGAAQDEEPAAKKAAVIPRAAQSKSYWDSKPLHTSDGKGVSFMAALTSAGIHGHAAVTDDDTDGTPASVAAAAAAAAPVQKNKVSHYFQSASSSPAVGAAARATGGGGLLEEFLSVNAAEDSAVAGLDGAGDRDRASFSYASAQSRLRGGIRNLGNTCYMSATLQALMSSEVLMKVLESQFWSNLPAFLKLQQQQQQQDVQSVTADATAEPSEVDDLTTTATTGSASAGAEKSKEDRYAKHSLFNELLRLVHLKREMIFKDPVLSSAQFGTNFILNNSLDISRLRAAATRLTNKFHGFQQQDAHEFLNDFNSSLQDELHHYLTQYVSCIQQCSDTPSAEADRDDDGNEGGGALSHSSKKADLSFFSPSGVTDFKSPPTTQVKPPSDPSAAGGAGDAATAEAPKVDHDSFLLPISKCFNSCVEVRCICKNCGFERPTREETYRDFSVELNEFRSSPLHLENLFSSFFDDEERELTCEHCQRAATAADVDGHGHGDGESVAPTVDSTATTVLEEMTQPLTSEPSVAESNAGKVIMSARLVSLPEILVIHLKRFQYSYESGTFRKVNCNVSFPLTLSAENCSVLAATVEEMHEKMAIDLSTGAKSSSAGFSTCAACDDVLSCHPEKVLMDSTLTQSLLHHATSSSSTNDVTGGGSVQYQLYALVRHIGEESIAGHYICDVRKEKGVVDSIEEIESLSSGANGAGGVSESEFKLNWLRYNDAQVTKVTENLVLNEQDTPYIFFYKKVETASG